MDELHEYLLNLEELAWEANRKGDVGFFSAYLTDDSLAVASRGRFDKATVLESFADPGTELAAVRIYGSRLVRLVHGAVVLSYQAVVDVARGPAHSTFGMYATTAYIRRDGVWYAAFNQITPMERMESDD